MPTLRVVKADVKPALNEIQPSTWYMVKSGSVTPHKAWRVANTNDRLQVRNVVFEGMDTTGATIFSTPNSGSLYNGIRVFADAINPYYFNTTTNSPYTAGTIYTGIIPTTPTAVLKATISFRFGYEKNIKIQYSDDTTDGTDGTWIDADYYNPTTSDSTPVILVSQVAGFNLYVSDKTGKYLTEVPSSDSLPSIGQGILDENGHVVRLPDIAARDTFTATANGNSIIRVEDTTGDPNSADGGPTYYFYFADTDTLVLYYKPSGSTTISSEEW